MSLEIELPATWSTTTLEDVTRPMGGGTPSKADPAYWTDGTVPWVSPKDMKTFRLRGSQDKVSTKALERLSLIPRNSVLVVVRSGILSRTLPVALSAEDVTINQDMRAFIPRDVISSEFLAWQLVAREQEILDVCSKDGTTVASIEGPALARFPIFMAPAAEQTRIVAKLEELLSDLEAGVAELKAAQAKLARYRQSLLKAAVDGALTTDWRARHTPAETGAQLLARILTERRARWEDKQRARFAAQGKTPPKNWQAKYPEPVAPDTTELPALPAGWVWASLGQLLSELTSGSRDWAPYYDRGKCTFVMAQNVRPWRPDFSFRQLVDPPLGHRDRSRSEIRKDDILVTIVGANTGQCCRVAEQLEDHFVCQSVALMRPVDGRLSEFINAVLNSHAHGQRQFREMNYGAGRPHLSFDQLESVLVPLAPICEQREIVRHIEESVDALNVVDLRIQDLEKYCRAQRKNLLKAAFAGQLVLQNPADEPASVLLERIRAERDARGAVRQGRGGRRRRVAQGGA